MHEMKTLCTLMFCFTVILDSIGLCIQSQLPAEPCARARSRSPTLRQIFPSILGFKFEDLAFIRLRPHNHLDRTFELRKYIFPSDKSIGFRTRNGGLKPIPTGERIVLSTSDVDVCAVLEKSYNRPTTLRGIFISRHRVLKRVKINMDSGVVKELTTEEIAECPVSTHEQVAKSYAVFRLGSQSEGFPDSDPDPRVHRCEPSSSSDRHPSNTTSLLAAPHDPASPATPDEPPLREGCTFSDLRLTFPSVLGYRFEDLELIRLIPHNYPHRIFKLRIYVFPTDKRIGLRSIYHILNPMPSGDQIVLSKPNGDVCATLQKTSSRCALLRPIFTQIPGISGRVRINIHSGAIAGLSAEEILECPVTSGEAITKHYKVQRV